ncbi:FecR family protein [Pedobacter immunditicola]|uniref:FecR family protein n=1 Tax=Pedobacter immunditicola TaxID=3133440 RepID=UPI0030AB8E87
MNYNREKIYNLLIEKIAGCISVEDNAEIENHILQDEETRAIWKDLQEKHASRGAAFLNAIDEDKAWLQVKQLMDKQGQPKHKTTNLNFQKWLSVAAIITVLLTATYIFNKQFIGLFNIQDTQGQNTASALEEHKIELKLANGKSIAIKENGTLTLGNAQLSIKDGKLKYTAKDSALNWNTLTVPAKMSYKLELSDGTEVWMNSASNLKFPFNFIGDKREVYLEGEAYFIVAKDINKPFIVHSKGTHVKVLGTAFNLNSYGEEVITSLIEGSVMNKTATDSITLKPGLQSIYHVSAGFRQKKFDADQVLSWMDGVYYFDNITLENMGDVIKRWFNVKLVIDNPEIRNLSFTGAIEKNKSLGYFMSNLESASGIKAYMKNGELHLK